MKLLHFKSIIFLLFLFPIASNAAVFTWLGGDGEWHDHDNWDLGKIPSIKDGVIIPSGIVLITSKAEANYINIDGGHLEVYDELFMAPEIPWYGTSQTIKGIVIQNGSSLVNFGEIIIIEPSNSYAAADQIFCRGVLTNHNNATIYLEGMHRTGIKSNTQTSFIYNYGEMLLNNLLDGMHLIGPYDNFGELTIDASSFAIMSRHKFTTGVNSRTTIYGKIQNDPGAFWYQYGELDITHTDNSTYGSFSLLNAGYFEIFNTGSIEIYGSNKGIINTGTGTFRNRGEVEILNDKINNSAIWNSGFMVNHQSGTVNVSADFGVKNEEFGEVRNFGTWYIDRFQNSTNGTIHNYGIFANRPKGKLYVDGILYFYSSGLFKNQGHMFVSDDVAPAILMGFHNSGTLNDVHDHLTGVNNTGQRVHKHVGPFIEGVPVSNILDVGVNPQATVLDFYTLPTGGTLAGAYDIGTNTFTPNSNAVGLNSLYVRTKINKGNAIRRHKLIVENGINSNSSPLISPYTVINPSTNLTVSISPNPMMSNFKIDIKGGQNEKVNYAIYDLMGRLESNGQMKNTSSWIELPKDVSSGIYILTISNEVGKLIFTKQIRVIR